MADCPKCGRHLSVAGTCIKCGNVQDRSKWYAIADEAEEEERKQPARPVTSSRPRRPATSPQREDWYRAAGEEAPPVQDTEERSAQAPGQVPTSGNLHDWAEVSRGRKDPPFALMGVGAVVLLAVGGMVWYARRTSAPPPQPVSELPRRNIQKNHSYGFKVVPPDGFKQQVVRMPDFARGAHGEYTAMLSYHQPELGVEAYYFGELKKDSNLDTYANVQVSDLGKLTPLTTVPDGMKDYPTKGYLIDMGQRKALVYVAFAKPDRYLSVWVLAPSAKFAQVQGQVEAAARAFSIFTPDGPHPDKMMLQGNSEE